MKKTSKRKNKSKMKRKSIKHNWKIKTLKTIAGGSAAEEPDLPRSNTKLLSQPSGIKNDTIDYNLGKFLFKLQKNQCGHDKDCAPSALGVMDYLDNEELNKIFLDTQNKGMTQEVGEQSGIYYMDYYRHVSSRPAISREQTDIIWGDEPISVFLLKLLESGTPNITNGTITKNNCLMIFLYGTEINHIAIVCRNEDGRLKIVDPSHFLRSQNPVYEDHVFEDSAAETYLENYDKNRFKLITRNRKKSKYHNTINDSRISDFTIDLTAYLQKQNVPYSMIELISNELSKKKIHIGLQQYNELLTMYSNNVYTFKELLNPTTIEKAFPLELSGRDGGGGLFKLNKEWPKIMKDTFDATFRKKCLDKCSK